MLEAAKRCFEPNLLGKFPVFIDGHIKDVPASYAFALVSKGKELSCLHIILGMRCERLALQLTVEVEPANRLEGPWV